MRDSMAKRGCGPPRSTWWLPCAGSLQTPGPATAQRSRPAASAQLQSAPSVCAPKRRKAAEAQTELSPPSQTGLTPLMAPFPIAFLRSPNLLVWNRKVRFGRSLQGTGRGLIRKPSPLQYLKQREVNHAKGLHGWGRVEETRVRKPLSLPGLEGEGEVM